MEGIGAARHCSFALLKPSRPETPSIEILPDELLPASAAADMGSLWIFIFPERSGRGGRFVAVVAEDDPDEESHDQERREKSPPPCGSGAAAHCLKNHHEKGGRRNRKQGNL